MDANNQKPSLYKVKVYEVRLRQARRPLELAEPTLEHSDQSARPLHALLGNNDREHFAALFINGLNRITGAHVVAIGSQHGVAGLEARTVFRAAIVSCASAVVIGHYAPRRIMTVLFPLPLCSRRHKGIIGCCSWERRTGT
jgi:DNA repair protein RadC